MKIVEKYTGKKTYMFPNGAIATPEAVLEQFPAALTFTHIIETDENHEIMWSMQNLSATVSMYNIDTSLTESEKIAQIQEIVNAVPVQEEEIEDETAIAMERIASALEYQNLTTMEDVEE